MLLTLIALGSAIFLTKPSNTIEARPEPRTWCTVTVSPFILGEGTSSPKSSQLAVAILQRMRNARPKP